MAEGLKLFEFSNVISCLNMVFNSKFSNRNINKHHRKITSYSFLVVEIAYNPVLRRQKNNVTEQCS